MTLCPICGHQHPVGTPHMVFGTPITEVFGMDMGPVTELEPETPTPGEVTAILSDYERLLAKDAARRESKAAEMQRYRDRKRKRKK